MPIEMGPARPIGAISTRFSREARGQGSVPAQSEETSSSGTVQIESLAPGRPPVDADRVAEIRKAIEQNRYPIVPSKIADAMIAAEILLRSGK